MEVSFLINIASFFWFLSPRSHHLPPSTRRELVLSRHGHEHGGASAGLHLDMQGRVLAPVNVVEPSLDRRAAVERLQGRRRAAWAAATTACALDERGGALAGLHAAMEDRVLVPVVVMEPSLSRTATSSVA